MTDPVAIRFVPVETAAFASAEGRIAVILPPEGSLTGAARALDRLTREVYDELRVVARRQLAVRASGGTLSTTGLVHEAWLKLRATQLPTVSLKPMTVRIPGGS